MSDCHGGHGDCGGSTGGFGCVSNMGGIEYPEPDPEWEKIKSILIPLVVVIVVITGVALLFKPKAQPAWQEVALNSVDSTVTCEWEQPSASTGWHDCGSEAVHDRSAAFQIRFTLRGLGATWERLSAPDRGAPGCRGAWADVSYGGGNDPMPATVMADSVSFLSEHSHGGRDNGFALEFRVYCGNSPVAVRVADFNVY